MKLLDLLKSKIYSQYLIPYLGARNWRPAHMVPLAPVFLQADFGFDEEALIKTAVGTVRDSTMASFERLATLWQQVRYLDKYEVPGSFVECGVWKGGCLGLMALAHLYSHKKPFREIHLFDSFQGLPQPNRSVDGQEAISIAAGEADGKTIPIGACVASMEESRKLLIDDIGYPIELVKFHVGWFHDTLPRISPSIGPVGILRLDGDWYESTRICLNFLYEKVSSAGVVIIDDYGHFEGCKKAVDEFLGALGKPVLLNHIDYTGRFWVKS